VAQPMQHGKVKTRIYKNAVYHASHNENTHVTCIKIHYKEIHW